MSTFCKILLCIYLSIQSLHAQNCENFDNFKEGASYNSGFFIGNDDVVWNYTEAKGGQTIEGGVEPAICLNKSSSARVFSDTIHGGCKALSISFEQEYTSNCEASVFINSTCVAQLSTISQADIPLSINLDGLEYCGNFVISIIQNSSSSGHLTIDNISWVSLECNMVNPKVLQHLVEENTVEVLFSKDIDSASISMESFASDVPILYWSLIQKNKLSITLDLPQCGVVSINLRNITDVNGIELRDTSLSIRFYKNIEYGDVIISEIMFDPNPVVGLPEAEYLEIYNNTACPISLEDWILQVNSSSITFQDISIDPFSYLFFSSDTSFNKFSGFIQVVGFPTLVNTDASVHLINNQDVLVSSVRYSYSMHDNTVKKDGGWSLEIIDSKNLSSDVSNWNSSVNSNGGTPGYVNSIEAINSDISPPNLISIFPLSSTIIEVRFSEFIYSFGSVVFSDGIVVDTFKCSNIDRTCFQIHLKDSIELDRLYLVSFTDVTDASGNASDIDSRLAFPLQVLNNDIVINEILFNPRSNSFDFIELYNVSSKVIDLSTLKIANCNMETKEINDFTNVSEFPILFFPGEYCVLSNNCSDICMQYNCEATSHFLDLPSLPSFNDDQGCAMLLDKGTNHVDSVVYNENWHHELIYDKEGVSLERISVSMESTDRNNWHSAAETVGFATPGKRNSQSEDTIQDNQTFTQDCSVFTPNNDGYNDYISINYEFPGEGNFISAWVFNESGYCVRVLYNNSSVGRIGSVIWNGGDNDDSVVRNGIYIIKISSFNADGETIAKKFACAKM